MKSWRSAEHGQVASSWGGRDFFKIHSVIYEICIEYFYIGLEKVGEKWTWPPWLSQINTLQSSKINAFIALILSQVLKPQRLLPSKAR